MKTVIMKIAILGMSVMYGFIRLLKVQDKITFISRQSNIPGQDIQMLAREIQKQHPQTSVVVLSRVLGNGLKEQMGYCVHLVLQMYHISTSKMVVLDGYCIAASVLNHKPETVIVQIWHASCALKKFGWQTVGKPAGSSRATAEIMKMHRNYDYVLASSRLTGEAFCEGFNIPGSRLQYIGLPHYIQLTEKEHHLRRTMLLRYPKLKEKINLLYLPTFRKGRAVEIQPLAQAVDYGGYNLIVKPHVLSTISGEAPEAILDHVFSIYDWIKMADAVITDYSSVALEAAIAGKKLYFYPYDLEIYQKETGLNICFEKEHIGKYALQDADRLMERIAEPYDYEALNQFKHRYMEVKPEEAIADFMKLIKKAGNLNETARHGRAECLHCHKGRADQKRPQLYQTIQR